MENYYLSEEFFEKNKDIDFVNGSVYKDRNYIVYKGDSIKTEDLFATLSSKKFKNSDEMAVLHRNKDVKMMRNYNHFEEVDYREREIHDYDIHKYKDYMYLVDFDVLSLFFPFDRTLDYSSGKDIYEYQELGHLYEFAGLDDTNYYDILPKLLYNSKRSDLAYLLLQNYVRDNISYVLYDKKNKRLDACNIVCDSSYGYNYDGVYYSVFDNGEQMLSNNPDLLAEYSDDVRKLYSNHIYSDGVVRKLKWRN